ncbi:MAG: hypothetical protein HYX93_03415 [Chloroflexi bacterium]|nr:hypothetical protein [Chloroflexota bacterium]
MTQEIGIREVFQQMDARLGVVESAIESLRQEIQNLRQEIQEIRREQWTNFRWMVGILVGTLFPMWATVILTIILRT